MAHPHFYFSSLTHTYLSLVGHWVVEDVPSPEHLNQDGPVAERVSHCCEPGSGETESGGQVSVPFPEWNDDQDDADVEEDGSKSDEVVEFRRA